MDLKWIESDGNSVPTQSMIEVMLRNGEMYYGTIVDEEGYFKDMDDNPVKIDIDDIAAFKLKTKYCPQCQTEKLADDFHNNHTQKDGKHSRCKDCNRPKPRKKGAPSQRGKAKKPKRNSRKVIEDPNIVDPQNRPPSEEVGKSVCGRIGNMERLVYETIDRIKSGTSLEVCREALLQQINPNTKKPFSTKFVTDVVLHANRLIKKHYEINTTDMISLHIKRYDEEIQKLREYRARVDPTKPWLAKNKNVLARIQCLEVLQQKEELLGMHRKAFKVVINEEETTIVQEQKGKIDVTRLTIDELIEFNTLIEKTRKTEDEISGVILRTREDRDIEDVEVETIKEKLNIDRMENRLPKTVNPSLIPSTQQDLEFKIRLALSRQAKKELMKAGSKTIQYDEIEDGTM